MHSSDQAMLQPSHVPSVREHQPDLSTPILIGMLGSFRVLKAGRVVTIRDGGKIELLLCTLALRYTHAVSRETLLDALWPGNESTLASQSLHSLIHGLHKLLGDAIAGASPVLNMEGKYCLNLKAGVNVDIACFDAMASAGDRQAHGGHHYAAVALYQQAICLYEGDLAVGADTHAIIERERLRARFLSMLARLADHHYNEGNYAACLDSALRLLANDPCREDAHRMVMRCHVRQGERAQALRQYRLCEGILQAEYAALPEPATVSLFDAIRLNLGPV